MKLAALAAAAAALIATPALAQGVPYACPVTATHVVANDGLTRSKAAVKSGRIVILAVGSSSIEGVGASSRSLGFVPLLQAGLERRLPGVQVTLINRGIGGETARDTAMRLEAEVTLARPDLVIWQLGTNDVLRDRLTDDILTDFQAGRSVLDRARVDVLLIDPQRLPETTTNPSFMGRNPALGDISTVIDQQAAASGYAVLHRFSAMADWSGLDRGGVGPDDLHLNDWGYACWAEVTAEGLADALR